MKINFFSNKTVIFIINENSQKVANPFKVNISNVIHSRYNLKLPVKVHLSTKQRLQQIK